MSDPCLAWSGSGNELGDIVSDSHARQKSIDGRKKQEKRSSEVEQ